MAGMDLFEEFEEAAKRTVLPVTATVRTLNRYRADLAPPPPDDPDEDEGAGIVGGEGFVLIGAK